MTTDTANLIWGPLENCRTLLASSATYHTLVGATGDAAAKFATAKATIYIPSLRENIAAARPFSILDQGQTWRTSGTLVGSFAETGGIFWLLEADVAAANQGTTAAKLEAAAKAFYKTAGDILKEMREATGPSSGTDPILRITGATLVDLMRSDPKATDAEGDFYQCIMALDWARGRPR